MNPAEASPSTSVKKRKKIALVYWGICLILLLAGFLYWLLFWRYYEWTDDAYVEGNQVFATPLQDGFIQSIHTDDTYLVKKGQLIIEMDETDALIDLEHSKENLAQTVRQVCQLYHDYFAYKAEIKVKKAELIKAIQDYQHRHDVIDAGGVSLEDLEHAIAALRANYYSLEWTKSLYKKAQAAIQGTSIHNHPLVLAASDQLRQSWVNLYRCNIYSPVDGLVAQRKIQVGMWVKAGDPLLSVIPLDQIWVNANYKETQLKHMRIGQRVNIRSDLYGRETVFHGKIAGLPGAAGNAFSLLPPQNLSGNWIKIVQRLPVRVELDPEELIRHPLRIGLSMEATVDLRDQGGKLVPTTSEGSPNYETPIFEIEEHGDEDLIQSIIDSNLDPLLTSYATTPLMETAADDED